MNRRPSVAVRVTEAMMEAAAGDKPSLRRAEPCTLVIFGATGDLSHRKLMPSLFRLMVDGLLADRFAIVGVGRSEMTDDAFRAGVADAIREFCKDDDVGTAAQIKAFTGHLTYVSGELHDAGTYAKLSQAIAGADAAVGGECGHLFYMAIPPSMYAPVVKCLAESRVAPRIIDPRQRPWTRVIIEKPFGRSLDTARELNQVVRQALSEHQVYRIDHYLGKETVQNMLMFRFANSIFEPVWNRHHIHHVQITAAETVGVEHRAGYYEEAGVVRDMFQNHLLQLLTLVAMEPPVRYTADAVRDEKVKVLRALREFDPDDPHATAVRGQYGPGMIDGKRVPGYREEPGVAKDSRTPTYAAVRFLVDNWRWQGVPFFLRSGKRLASRATELAIQFRLPPHVLFPLKEGQPLEPNMLVARIQPREGLALRFEVKTPGVDMKMASVDMEFDYKDAFGSDKHDAYETLLLDGMCGEATLFTRADEVEEAWRAVDPLIGHWEHTPVSHFPNYAAGSWGPEVADEFIGRVGGSWRILQA